MDLVSIVLGQAVRLLRARNPIGGTYLPDVVTAFRERYGFIEAPSTVAEYQADATKGVTFKHGKFRVGTRQTAQGRISEEIVIDSLHIFNDGLIANTKSFVEDADLFLDDVIKWSIKSFGYSILEDPPIRHAYTSQVEVSFPKSLVSLFDELKGLNDQITTALAMYGNAPPSYSISGFSLHCDTTKLLPPIPTAFTFERRAQHPFTSNLYFSTAPLKTTDHIKVLEELEKIASNMRIGKKPETILGGMIARAQKDK